MNQRNFEKNLNYVWRQLSKCFFPWINAFWKSVSPSSRTFLYPCMDAISKYVSPGSSKSFPVCALQTQLVQTVRRNSATSSIQSHLKVWWKIKRNVVAVAVAKHCPWQKDEVAKESDDCSATSVWHRIPISSRNRESTSFCARITTAIHAGNEETHSNEYIHTHRHTNNTVTMLDSARSRWKPWAKYISVVKRSGSHNFHHRHKIARAIQVNNKVVHVRWRICWLRREYHPIFDEYYFCSRRLRAYRFYHRLEEPDGSRRTWNGAGRRAGSSHCWSRRHYRLLLSQFRKRLLRVSPNSLKKDVLS